MPRKMGKMMLLVRSKISSAAAMATVTVSGVQSDDYGNTMSTATPLPADNSDLTGRIDHTGDEDWFAVTPVDIGRLAVRVANLGGLMNRKEQRIQPRGVCDGGRRRPGSGRRRRGAA